MNTTLSTMLTVAIPSIISLVGFIVTYALNKRNFVYEVSKQKAAINLDKIADLPQRLQMQLDNILTSKNSDMLVKEFKEITSLIFAYGSKDAILIAANAQESINSAAVTGNTSSNPVIPYRILLICQIKYDASGIETNPELWYRLRLSDYTKMKATLVKQTNDIVDKLNLSSFLYIN